MNMTQSKHYGTRKGNIFRRVMCLLIPKIAGVNTINRFKSLKTLTFYKQDFYS